MRETKPANENTTNKLIPTTPLETGIVPYSFQTQFRGSSPKHLDYTTIRNSNKIVKQPYTTSTESYIAFYICTYSSSVGPTIFHCNSKVTYKTLGFIY